VLRSAFRLKRKELIRGFRKGDVEKVHNLYSLPIRAYCDYIIKKNERGRNFGSHDGEEKVTQNIGEKS